MTIILTIKGFIIPNRGFLPVMVFQVMTMNNQTFLYGVNLT
jgi:hypothetical protein